MRLSRSILSLAIVAGLAWPAVRPAGAADGERRKEGPGASDAIVLVYATIDGTDYVGTGFFHTPTGELATAYHVVQGASSVEIAGSNKLYSDHLSMLKYSTKTDIAILRTGLRAPHFLKLSAKIPEKLAQIKEAGRAFAFGNPDGNTAFKVPVSFPRDEAIYTKDWRPTGIFYYPFETIIPVELTFDGGMSGGPVIVDDEVIGVLSGGRAAGGRDFGWAIPVDDMGKLAENKSGKRFAELPKLDLFREGVAPARLKAVQLVVRAADRYFQRADQVRKKLVIQRTRAEKIKELISQPNAKGEDLEQAHKLLADTTAEILPSSDLTLEYMKWAKMVLTPALKRGRGKSARAARTKSYGENINKTTLMIKDLAKLGGDYENRRKAFGLSSSKLQDQAEVSRRGLAELSERGMGGSPEALDLCTRLLDAYAEKLSTDIDALEGTAMILQLTAEMERHFDQMLKEDGDRGR